MAQRRVAIRVQGSKLFGAEKFAQVLLRRQVIYTFVSGVTLFFIFTELSFFVGLVLFLHLKLALGIDSHAMFGTDLFIGSSVSAWSGVAYLALARH